MIQIQIKAVFETKSIAGKLGSVGEDLSNPWNIVSFDWLTVDRTTVGMCWEDFIQAKPR